MTTYLGNIELTITSDGHITNKILKTIHSFLNIRNMFKVKHVFCQSIIEHGVIAWGGATNATIGHVEMAQETMKIILKKRRKNDTNHIFNKFGLLNVR